MGLFFWKNNRKIDLFAIALADDLYSHVQPHEAKRFLEGRLKKEKKKQARVRQWFDSVVNEMQKFADAHSLGIYGKARLQKQFSDRLLELGYDDTVTRTLVEQMVVRTA